jgi:hypothetical protein
VATPDGIRFGGLLDLDRGSGRDHEIGKGFTRALAARGITYLTVTPAGAGFSRGGMRPEPSESATFAFDVEMGRRCVVWGRVLAPDGGANSFYVSLLGANRRASTG